MTKRLAIIGLASVSAVVFFLLAGAFGAEFQVQTGPGGPTEEMTWLNVVILSLVVGTLGLLLAFGLDRFSSGRAIWTATAVVVYLAMFVPLFQLELTGGDLLWQSILHSVFAVPVILGFWVNWPLDAD